ncbi:MAG: hypothetical protein GX410_05020 [Elusimicrobia bacterium]|nr:hypothetical protein [Elusimicrobiota bacterium]
MDIRENTAEKNPWRRPLLVLGSSMALTGAILLYSLGGEGSFLRARALLNNTSYYFMAALCACWVYALLRVLDKAGRQPIRECLSVNKWGIAAALALSALIFVSVKPQIRVLSDEANLVGVSKSMFMAHKSNILTQARWVDGEFVVARTVPDKRPMLFPFAINILHVFTGYRMANAYALNFICTFVYLALVFCVARAFLGGMAGIAAMLFTASYPLFNLCATSAGFETFSLLFLGLSLLAFYRYLKNPEQEEFAFFWGTLCMYSYTRYECGAVFAVLFLLVLQWRVLRPDHFRPAWFYFLAPLLFLPMLWQRLALKLVENPEYSSAFSLSVVPLHLTELFYYFLSFSYRLPYAAVLNLAFLIALALMALRAAGLKPSLLPQFQRRFLWGLGLSFAALLSIWMLYHFKLVYSGPTSARIFLPLCALAALSPLAIALYIRSVRPVMLLAFSMLTFVIYLPLSLYNVHQERLGLPRQMRYVQELMRDYDGHNFLLITTRPGHFVIHDYGAVDYIYARARAKQLMEDLLKRRYSDIFVLQEISLNTGRPTKESVPPDGFSLEPFFEREFKEGLLMRLSRVVPDPEFNNDAQN